MAKDMAYKIRRFFCLTKAAHHGSIRVALPVVLLICTLSIIVVFPAWAETTDKQSTKRGEYIYRLAGCESCHTDNMNKKLGPAGGVALDTSFGTFYTPNITPDQETGIGGWSDQQFFDAMRKGLSPAGTVKRGETAIIHMDNQNRWLHAMHIHGHHFKSVETDNLLDSAWRDTVLLNGSDRKRIAFVANNPGKWLIHCHMIEHQAGGMVTWFEVV
jgi:FtsP/CotA-like multicopper oxidase with cupredoxin domain